MGNCSSNASLRILIRTSKSRVIVVRSRTARLRLFFPSSGCFPHHTLSPFSLREMFSRLSSTNSFDDRRFRPNTAITTCSAVQCHGRFISDHYTAVSVYYRSLRVYPSADRCRMCQHCSLHPDASGPSRVYYV